MFYNSSENSASKYYILVLVATCLALVVVMLGAYTRLSDAGLGCPDWPGCYGKLVLPKSETDLSAAQQLYPMQPIEAKKAWTEMIHRYFAGTLGVLIFSLAIWALIRRSQDWRKRGFLQQPLLVPWLLVAMVIFQAMLGMWTVTLKLLPLVVMGHLLGGMIIAALLWWLALSMRQYLSNNTYQDLTYSSDMLNDNPINFLSILKPWALVGVVITLLQIFLGAWTSTNYAALACPTFPFCNGTLSPQMDWHSAFNFLSPIGPNYEGGKLLMDARVAIQMAHRYGAILTTIYLLPFSLFLIFSYAFMTLRKQGILLLTVIAIQIILGVLNVVLILPMWTAVAHNGIAAMLLLTMVTIYYKTARSDTLIMNVLN